MSKGIYERNNTVYIRIYEYISLGVERVGISVQKKDPTIKSESIFTMGENTRYLYRASVVKRVPVDTILFSNLAYRGIYPGGSEELFEPDVNPASGAYRELPIEYLDVIVNVVKQTLMALTMTANGKYQYAMKTFPSARPKQPLQILEDNKTFYYYFDLEGAKKVRRVAD